jgi:hypothetical protein
MNIPSRLLSVRESRSNSHARSKRCHLNLRPAKAKLLRSVN